MTVVLRKCRVCGGPIIGGEFVVEMSWGVPTGLYSHFECPPPARAMADVLQRQEERDDA